MTVCRERLRTTRPVLNHDENLVHCGTDQNRHVGVRALGTRRPPALQWVRRVPTIRNADDRARIHHSTAGWFPSRTCDDGVTDHRPGRRGGAEPRPTGMPNESAGPSAHHSAVPIVGNSTVLVRGARVKDLIRRLRSAPGRRRGRR